MLKAVGDGRRYTIYDLSFTLAQWLTDGVEPNASAGDRSPPPRVRRAATHRALQQELAEHPIGFLADGSPPVLTDPCRVR
jgi:hypothetical protein